jgi:hypothetical protein
MGASLLKGAATEEPELGDNRDKCVTELISNTSLSLLVTYEY